LTIEVHSGRQTTVEDPHSRRPPFILEPTRQEKMTQVDERDISPAVGINRVKAVSLALNLTGDSGPIDTMKFSENPDAPRKKGRERSSKQWCFHAGSTGDPPKFRTASRTMRRVAHSSKMQSFDGGPVEVIKLPEVPESQGCPKIAETVKTEGGRTKERKRHSGLCGRAISHAA
jgi:hypothetical protein